ncbi:uncharacterized protein LOC129291433 isoform X4 [Prosopis cineraria]|uniref:uncharacterized protein LOC129291433 isoform X4 n=1 Tax=Prosopis cineraria TaxID=364024 RepID=UPI00240F5189|nr:uncharacterized protein LOC129291433 isoform X4 [Prosopis cineraria]
MALWIMRWKLYLQNLSGWSSLQDENGICHAGAITTLVDTFGSLNDYSITSCVLLILQFHTIQWKEFRVSDILGLPHIELRALAGPILIWSQDGILLDYHQHYCIGSRPLINYTKIPPNQPKDDSDPSNLKKKKKLMEAPEEPIMDSLMDMEMVGEGETLINDATPQE